MPHDCNGDLLQVGDRVLIPAEVINITSGEDYCNLTVKTTIGRKPDDLRETMTLNAAVVKRNMPLPGTKDSESKEK